MELPSGVVQEVVLTTDPAIPPRLELYHETSLRRQEINFDGADQLERDQGDRIWEKLRASVCRQRPELGSRPLTFQDRRVTPVSHHLRF